MDRISKPTYRQFIDSISYELKEDGEEICNLMQIPHPNGKVYLIVEKFIRGIESQSACFEASKEDGEWVMKPVSKDFSDRLHIENPLFDLSVLFNDLLPKD